jgi:hypothetical protein
MSADVQIMQGHQSSEAYSIHSEKMRNITTEELHYTHDLPLKAAINESAANQVADITSSGLDLVTRDISSESIKLYEQKRSILVDNMP